GVLLQRAVGRRARHWHGAPCPTPLLVKRFQMSRNGFPFKAKPGYLTPASAVGAMMESGAG
ncbi:MAG: hypothetical protein OXC69_08870, partial [Candidatus Tectomicrobia bacterium]|nr:hypothetical protein [Candidatus Tectomicrobia bacterium]